MVKVSDVAALMADAPSHVYFSLARYIFESLEDELERTGELKLDDALLDSIKASIEKWAIEHRR